MKKSNKKKSNKIFNSPAVGLGSLLILNALVVYFVINISRYISVQRRLFMYLFIGLVALILVANMMFAIGYGKRYKFARQGYLGVSLLLILVIGVGSIYITRLNRSVDGMVNNDTQEKTEYSFISVKEGQSLENLSKEIRIGYVSQDDTYKEKVENEIASHSNEVEVIVFESYHDLFHELLNSGELEIAVVPRQYSRYADNFDASAQDLLDSAVVLKTFSITSVVTQSSKKNVLKEPFTVLLMGLNDNLADSIILVSVNPKTLHITMTSVARDLYVPIACNSGNRPDKLNHSRGRSRQCMIDTIEDLFDIDIDFFFEADFFAMMKIVDALGGLELDVPHEFGRMLPIDGKPGESEWIVVPAGRNLLNGKQVVNFTRERKTFASGDFQRQLNQQYVLKELALKIVNESKKNFDVFIKVLEAAQSNISMNLSMDRDLSPLIGLAINNITASPVDPLATFVIQNSQIAGITPKVNGMSVIVPFRASLADNRKIIHDNLSTVIKEPQYKRFVFSANRPYQFGINTNSYQYYGTEVQWPNGRPMEETDDTPVVDETPTGNFTVPNMTDGTMDLASVKAWGRTHNVEIKVRLITSETQNLDKYKDEQIINQTIEPGSYDKRPGSITISVVDKTDQAPQEPDVSFKVPKMTEHAMSVSEVQAWGKSNGVNINIRWITSNDQEIDQYDDGQIINQTVSEGNYDKKPTSITISVVKKEASDDA